MFSPPRGAADEPSKPRPKAIGRGAMLARKKGGTSQPVNSTPAEASSPPPPAISEPTTPPPGRVAKLAKIKYPKIVRNFYDFLPNFYDFLRIFYDRKIRLKGYLVVFLEETNFLILPI